MYAGMLEAMAGIEARAYELMAQLGARPRVTRVLTAGGGAVNAKWTQLRAAAIGVPVERSQHGDASYGAALLAQQAAQSAHNGAADVEAHGLVPSPYEPGAHHY
jgi:sugar (pentulose or hexulose) kinase